MAGLPAVGEPAPDFELPNQFGEPVSLSGLAGSPVALVFYPFAFSGVCTGELCELQENLAIFEDRRVRLLGVSVDHKYTLRAYAEDQGYTFDLLADFWPHGSVASSYGVFNGTRGFAERATFLVDSSGILRSVLRSELAQPRKLQEYREAIAALEAGTA